MTGRPRPIPTQSKPVQQPVSQLPARAVTQDKTADELYVRLFCVAMQGLVQRSDLEWEAHHLVIRASIYAEAAYKQLKGL